MSLYLNIESETKYNQEYRKILYTDGNLQVILQSLKPKETVPFEIHETATQFIRVESGFGSVTFNNIIHNMHEGDAIVIPKMTFHKVENTGTQDFRFYTIYSPKVH